MHDERRCRAALLGLLLTGMASWAGLRILRRADKPDFVSQSDFDLSGHAISAEGARARPVLVLGSCQVEGNPFLEPDGLAETLSASLAGGGPVYNLARGGNILSILSFLRLALPFRPRLVLVGLTPDEFGILPRDSPVYFYHPELLQDELPEAVRAKLAPFCRPWFRLFFVPLAPAFNPVKAAVYRALFRWQRRFYGFAFGEARVEGTQPFLGPVVSLSGDEPALVETLKGLAREGGARLVVFVPPLPAWALAEGQGERRALLACLKASGVRTLDYSGLLPPDGYDGLGMRTPEGTRRLAERLARDLIEESPRS